MPNAQSSNIFLTGFMGAGKSTVGRALAQQLGYRFADLDQLIVEREGRSIREVFAAQGEAYFRDCESAVLAEQCEETGTVFATGGGIVGREKNRALMKAAGVVVYLYASWPVLRRRLEAGSGRPLADPAAGWDPVQLLWQSRLPWYEEANMIIDTDRLRVAEVVAEIIAGLGLAKVAP